MPKLIISSIVSILLLFACSSGGDSSGRGDSESIKVGVGWPLSVKDDLFRQGVELAIQDINASGGVLGKQLEAVYKDDLSRVNLGKTIAQEFAEDPEMTAVIGHFDSFISLPAAVTYQFYGLLMMSPGTTDPRLTKQGFSKVFRSIPNDLQVGEQLAQIARGQGWDEAIIIHEQTDYGRQLANAIELNAEGLGVKIADRLSFDPGNREYRLLNNRIRLLKFDGIFFVGFGADGESIIRQTRTQSINAPFIASNGLDTSDLFAVDSNSVEGTLVLSFFHIDNPDPYVQHFRKHFAEAFGSEPDAWAAQGYDSVMLMAHSIRLAQSADPQKMADALHNMDAWFGVTGKHRFDDKGDVQDKPMVVKVARNGKLEFYSE